MKAITILLLFAFLAFNLLAIKADPEDKSHHDFEPTFPKNLKDNGAYKKFIKIVENNNMNVTVVISKIEKFRNHKLKEAFSACITLPVNNEHLRQTKLKKSDKDFLKLAETNQLVANIRHVKISGGEIQAETVETNKENATVVTEAQKLLTKVTKGHKGFQFDGEKNFVSLYTFRTLTETTKVHFGQLAIDTESQSNMSDKEIKFIKNILFNIHFVYEDFDMKSKMLVINLQEKYPKHNWQVAADAGENSYIGSDKFLTVKLFTDKYTIFAI